QKPAQPTPNIFTGGYNFVKKDGNSSTSLVGVEFQVKDKDGNVLSFIKNANNEWVIADSTATGASATISTQTDGKLAINGLKTGDYTLVETKTLDGYVLPANPNTAFKVVTNEAGAGTYTATKGDAAGVVTNVKKGILPSTGGTGIYAFLTIGAALMIGAIVWYKKSKDS
ncbi:LPXTG cell wall anchor domain-containing protein, partial [Escherichia coli]